MSAPVPEGAVPSESVVERMAKAIVGPHNPVPTGSRFSLLDLREVRWSNLTLQDQGYARIQARAALAAQEQSPPQADLVALRADIVMALKCTPTGWVNYDCGDPWEILRGSLARIDAALAQADQRGKGGDA